MDLHAALEANPAARNVVAVVLFCLTYALIAVRRLRWLPIGRPAGALLGAVAMVGLGVLTPKQSYAAINQDTIALLLGMMLITAYLDEAAFFDWIVGRFLAWCRTPWQLLVLVAVLSAGLSAFLVNDTVCLFMTPVVVLTCTRTRLPMGPFLIAIATSANIGSAATLVGNPQNMIIAHLSKLPFLRFLAVAGPAAAVGLVVNVGLLWLYYGRRLPARLEAEQAPEAPQARDPAKLRRVLVVVGLVVLGFLANLDLGYTTLAGACALMVLERVEPRRPFEKVDWTLLVFFCGLFVVVAGLERTGFVERVWTEARPRLDLSTTSGLDLFAVLIVIGSNLVSNVPLVLLTGPYLEGLGAPPVLAWGALAFVSTIAGNLTLIGSVANIIVAEGAKEHYTLGFVEYLKFGLVSTLLVLAAGLPVLVLAARLAG